jgi:3-oxoacyl-[acyl-carrier-protein] synthase-1
MLILSTGLVCSVGFTAATACAAMRARIAKFDDLPYYHLEGEQVVGAAVPCLECDFEDPKRLVEMLSLAVEDCLGNSRDTPRGRIPLILCLSEEGRPGGASGQTIAADVAARHGVMLDANRIVTVPKGHVAGFEGLRMARELFNGKGITECIIGAVDSYLNAESLHWLERHWRLKTSQNSDGVIPGEAAAAILVGVQSVAATPPIVRVGGLGFAREPATILSEDPLLGTGLAQAARAALEEGGIRFHEIDFRLSDVTGESYGFKEQALATARLHTIRRDDMPIWHCADSIGDTGAAAGLCQLVIAQHAFTVGYAPGNRALCFASAVSGERAAVVVEKLP